MHFEWNKAFLLFKSELLTTPVFEANTCRTISKTAGKVEFQQAIFNSYFETVFLHMHHHNRIISVKT